MIRNAHRTVFARAIAALLLVLAVSPVTAPFSVIDTDDFQQSRPVDAHHPAHDMAEAHVKVAPQIVVTAPAPTLVSVGTDRDTRATSPLPKRLVMAPRAMNAVLRL